MSAHRVIWFMFSLTIVTAFSGVSAQDVIDAPPDPEQYTLEPIAEGLERPIFVTHAGDGSGRLFIIHQPGWISIVDANGELLETPFLDIQDRIAKLEGFTEQGLLGLAFHPNYEENGRFFVSFTAEDETVFVVEYRVSADDANVADVTTERLILRIRHPATDHNGGDIQFGPDGNLYISVGDGGGLNDPERAGQNMMVPLGKILRISVEDDTVPYKLLVDNPYVGTGMGMNEIWLSGVRNPYRFSFDPATGDMYIGDVGQSMFEEVNFVPAGEKGLNFGWSRYEGPELFNEDVPENEPMIPPIFSYNHSEERCAIIGGHVYRGAALPELNGYYVYSDYCSGDIYTLHYDSNGQWNNTYLMPTGSNVTGIGLDEAGELYFAYYKLADLTGGVVRLVAAE